MVEITLSIMLQFLQTAGILVGIIYYITIMRNQQRNQELSRKAQEQALETRQAQLLLNLMNTYRGTEFRRQWHTLFHIEWKDFEDFKERFYGQDVEVMSAYTSLMTFYDSVGVLVKSGLIEVNKVYSLLASGIKMTWERYLPLIMGDRIYFQEDSPRGRKVWEHFEYLYDEIMRIDQQSPS